MFLNNIDLYCKNSDIIVILLLEQIIPISCEQILYHMLVLAVFALLMNFLGSVYGTDCVNNCDMKREVESKLYTYRILWRESNIRSEENQYWAKGYL